MRAHRVRPPVCADDRWYPRDAAQLRQRLDQLLAQVDVTRGEGGLTPREKLIALIAPHAGYAFSGQTAAYAYKQLEGRAFNRAVVIGPSHFADYGAHAMNQADTYATPLGEIPLDAPLVNALQQRLAINFIPFDREHSIEMQLPFLQRMLGEFSLVPIIMSYPFYIVGLRARNACEELALVLGDTLDDQTLLVASSDLAHLHSYEAVTYFDQGLENYIAAYNMPGLIDYMINEGENRACGDMAIVTVMMAARARGANQVKVLYRTNSGDVTGMREEGQYTVGYMAAALYRA